MVSQTTHRGRPRSVTQDFRFVFDNGVNAVGRGVTRFVPKKIYERVRQLPDRGEQVAPADNLWTDSLTVASNSGGELASDHWSDHISAIQLISATEKCLLANVPLAAIVEIQFNFTNYTEHSPEANLRIAVEEPGRFHGLVDQGDSVRAHFWGRFKLPK